MRASSEALSASILGKPSLRQFTEAVKIVVGIFSGAGQDISPWVRRLALAKFPELAGKGLLPAREIENDSPRDTEEEISGCYARLRALAASQNPEEHARTLSRLRTLQEIQARRLASAFQAGRQIEPATAEKALLRADELLTAHEDPPGHD